MMQCLGEMATWLPLPGAIPQFCARYVDGSVGFAVGWNVSSAYAADALGIRAFLFIKVALYHRYADTTFFP